MKTHTLLLALFAILPLAAAADRSAYFLAHGAYDDDVGTHELPGGKTLAALPTDGWVLLEKTAGRLRLEAVPVPKDGWARHLAAELPPNVERWYFRVPDAVLRDGDVAEVPLKRRALVPKLDHDYALTLGTRAFTLRAANGFRGRDGAHYQLAAEGFAWDYLLPGFGFDHQVLAAGDFDRDGRPDFVVYVSASNSGTHYLLLSGQAKAGRNLPTASLAHGGC